MNAALETPAEEISLLADLTPQERDEFEEAVDTYNGGQPLAVPDLAKLFGVKANTIWAAWISDETQPSSEHIPGHLGGGLYDPRTAILWGLQTGRLRYVRATRSFERRKVARLLWPGKPRGPHRKKAGDED